MSDFMDRLPSKEKERVRKRMRSPEAYEALRERVKGPEDLEKEMQRNDRMAEVSYALESEPKTKEKLKAQIEKDIGEQGIESVLESVSDTDRAKIEQGKFTVAISSHPSTHEDALMVVPEGNVQEKIPVKLSMSDAYVASLQLQK
jgi:hypothetical protein